MKNKRFYRVLGPCVLVSLVVALITFYSLQNANIDKPLQTSSPEAIQGVIGDRKPAPLGDFPHFSPTPTQQPETGPVDPAVTDANINAAGATAPSLSQSCYKLTTASACLSKEVNDAIVSLQQVKSLPITP